MAAPEIGGEFAGYRIEALIGRGGMGLVYRAEQIRLKRKVALKVLAPEIATDESFRHRFIQESETAAGMDHPNIIPIFEAGDVEDQLYIAMRYVDGDDLKEVLQREGPLSLDRAAELLGQAAAALDAAHARGLVHRDVKPQNMLIQRGAAADDGDLVYLTDFGLIKEVSATQGMTAVGQFVGTIDYVAPEQMEGKRVDGRADVYALGCVLYECLVGTVPYARDSDVSTMLAHIQDPPPPLSTRRPDLPRELDAVVARAMAKSPDDRFSTCRELITALRQASRGGTVVAGAGSPTTAVSPAPVAGGTVVGPSQPSQPAAGQGPSWAPPAHPSDPNWQQAPAGQQPSDPSWPQSLQQPSPPSPPGYPQPSQPAGPGWGPPPSSPYSSGPQGAPPTKSKAPMFVALGLVALLVVGGGAFLLLGGDDDAPAPDESASSESAEPSATPSEAASDFPNDVEATLLTHLPPEFRDTCQRLDFDLPESTTAAVQCFPQGVDFVGYLQFALPVSMRRNYERTLETNNILKNTGSSLCNSTPPAEGTYTRGARTDGRLACYFDGNEAWMDWTSETLSVYSFATRSDGNVKKLFNFWVDAGPFGRRQ